MKELLHISSSDKRNRSVALTPKLPLTSLIQLLLLLTGLANAFYAFEKVQIKETLLDSKGPCEIATTSDLIAYQCPEYFKIFLLNSLDSVKLVYMTEKAVAQVKASKLTNDQFISFIEAKADTDSTPAAYAYLKVVDAKGVRDLGLNSILLPNRSLYLGGELILRVNEAQTNVQVQNVVTKTASNFINILSTKLVFDFYPVDATGSDTKKWIIAVCQFDEQKCLFNTVEGTVI